MFQNHLDERFCLLACLALVEAASCSSQTCMKVGLEIIRQRSSLFVRLFNELSFGMSARYLLGLVPGFGPPSLSRLSHESLSLAFCLAIRRCMNLGPSFL